MSSRSYADLFKQGLEASSNSQSFFASNSFNNLALYGGSTDRRVG
jgi:hypothetical protein